MLDHNVISKDLYRNCFKERNDRKQKGLSPAVHQYLEKKKKKEGNMIQVQFMGSVRGKKPVNACPESATSNSVFVSV